MDDSNSVDEREIHAAVQDVIGRVLDFDVPTRRRIFNTAEAFLFPERLTSTGPTIGNPYDSAVSSRPTSFQNRTEVSPKDFMFQKAPRTDVDRVACLGYFLTNYRDTPHFKTTDISLLNTEAAQLKLSNTAYAVINATNAGLLVPAGKGFKQLSAGGEKYVELLPDRAAAKESLALYRNRRRRKSRKNGATDIE
ncbi:MAG TPA: hypothetical protein VHX68_07850 [Planctomycetaceae bacterium]|jgi:hypothetical protein|nr:hypothetical protein [Planctomycetaceae bacterium]